MKKIIVKTEKAKEVLDITDAVNEEVSGQEAKSGLCHLFLTHTTAALTTADLDPGTDRDMLEALEAMTPRLKYRHPHDPKHVPDHIWSSLIGTSLTMPVEDGKIVLGTWQRVVLIEFDGPRDREVIISFVQEKDV